MPEVYTRKGFVQASGQRKTPSIAGRRSANKTVCGLAPQIVCAIRRGKIVAHRAGGVCEWVGETENMVSLIFSSLSF